MMMLVMRMMLLAMMVLMVMDMHRQRTPPQFWAELVRHGSIPASNKTLGVLPTLRRSIDAGAYRYSFSRPRALVLTVEASGGSTLGCARRRR